MREKRTISIFITLLLALSGSVVAQKTATAVMNVSVNVVSGTHISDVQNLDIDFDESKVNAGSFQISTPKHVDTSINYDPTITLVNQFGDEITLTSNSELFAKANTYQVQVGANIDSQIKGLRGTYTGTITTTVAYF